MYKRKEMVRFANFHKHLKSCDIKKCYVSELLSKENPNSILKCIIAFSFINVLLDIRFRKYFINITNLLHNYSDKEMFKK